MKKNTPNVDRLLDEPENYIEEGVKIQNLMKKLMDCKQDLKEISDLGLVQEQFSESSKMDLGAITQIIYSLGEIYGYTYADDTLEGVI